jgi:hypothetical protein
LQYGQQFEFLQYKQKLRNYFSLIIWSLEPFMICWLISPFWKRTLHFILIAVSQQRVSKGCRAKDWTRDLFIVGRQDNHISTPHPSTLLFGPQMALAYRLDAISQVPKNSRIPGPNPLPLALVMDMHTSKTLCTGLYNS